MAGKVLLAAIATGLFALQVVLLLYTGSYAWDDAAITLAFGKTLGATGRFALTAASGSVEGSSSLLFVFLAATIERVARLDFHQAITAFQLLAFGFSTLTLGLLFQYLKRYLNPLDAYLIAVSVVALPWFAAEVLNGMEMTAFAALVTLTLLAYERKHWALYLCIPLLLITRFEAIFYCVMAFGLAAIFSDRRSHRDWIPVLYSLLVFSAVTLWRYLNFADILPNTVRAKMHAPYTPLELVAKVHLKLAGAIDFLSAFGVLLLLLFLALALGRRGVRALGSLPIGMVLSFFLFSLVAGRVWGYEARMTVACFPAIVAAIASEMFRLKDVEVRVRGTVIATVRDGARFGASALIVALAFTFYAGQQQFKANLRTAYVGGSIRAMAVPGFGRLAQVPIPKAGTAAGIMPENYRITGLAVDALRSALGLSVIKFLTPDVGGVGLCCSRIDVLDSALLTSAPLAKRGYREFESYLVETRPDVIETHTVWSDYSRIYAVPFFRDQYAPVILEDTLFWVRKDLVARLQADGRSAEIVETSSIPASTRYYEAGSVDSRHLEKVYKGPIYALKLKR